MSTPYIPQFVTLGQIAKHTGKHYVSVCRALKAAGMMPDYEKGLQGKRIPVKTANRFIARQWPGTPLMPEPCQLPTESAS